jgi:DNA-binding response OmpR family regulator
MPNEVRKVLIIDDDPLLLETATQLLRSTELEVLTCDTRIGRLGMIHKHKPDLVLLDVNMPFLSGDQVLGLVRDLPDLCDVRIYLFSSNDEASLRRMARELGADGYIPKTAMASDFAQRVERALAPS